MLTLCAGVQKEGLSTAYPQSLDTTVVKNVNVGKNYTCKRKVVPVVFSDSFLNTVEQICPIRPHVISQ
jgi:hypothetical protein